ncbi:DNA-binding protein [Salmonella enterica subsp. diarizonae]|uniref:DNA-binding protein n=1 Tax=Salmonella diarizonae TaxID=59204 RepID=A0A5Y3W9C9_SALDZ|nr:DNA-binding protein [Salmonella enterica subsp. diarizonae]EBG1930087.1 DNA-binding protein [Salmonella enterica]EBZ8404115.1 DNA-binding protein [Salmonella enterica subsp. enterica serovar Muenchen]ECF1925046.1 DNA-binding protein [Salmonella enterica subsp. enterica serovar Newport]HEB6458762.1 DNA-binding protein [Salmonella enterica subsp. enterica serovar Hvittingfoss]
MTADINYWIEKYSFTVSSESVHLTRQWTEVLQECQKQQADPEGRLRIALLNVDYVTSFELPFRLLLLRAPQLIAKVRENQPLSQKNVIFNGKRFGCVYSLKDGISDVPDEFQYHLSHRIRRIAPAGRTETPYQQIAKEVKAPRERLKLALAEGLEVTALDGLFWFGCQRLAADVLILRKAGMRIATAEKVVSDNLTGTTRGIPVYRYDGS